MYEYVITAGPGIMLEHGVRNLDYIEQYAASLMDDVSTIMFSPARLNDKPERFH